MKTRLAGLALALALPLLPGSPTAQDPKPPRLRPSDRQQKEIERMEREIQGLWRIERMRVDQKTFQGSELVGYLLAAPDFLTIEYHIEHFTSEGGIEGIEYLFQTGIFEYRFTPLGELEAFGKIGTSSLDGSLPTFEPPGQRRVYDITLASDHMTLDRKTSMLHLVRVSRPAHTKPEPKAKR